MYIHTQGSFSGAYQPTYHYITHTTLPTISVFGRWHHEPVKHHISFSNSISIDLMSRFETTCIDRKDDGCIIFHRPLDDHACKLKNIHGVFELSAFNLLYTPNQYTYKHLRQCVSVSIIHLDFHISLPCAPIRQVGVLFKYHQPHLTKIIMMEGSDKMMLDVQSKHSLMPHQSY